MGIFVPERVVLTWGWIGNWLNALFPIRLLSTHCMEWLIKGNEIKRLLYPSGVCFWNNIGSTFYIDFGFVTNHKQPIYITSIQCYFINIRLWNTCWYNVFSYATIITEWTKKHAVYCENTNNECCYVCLVQIYVSYHVIYLIICLTLL